MYAKHQLTKNRTLYQLLPDVTLQTKKQISKFLHLQASNPCRNSSSAEALGLNPEGISLENDNYQWCWDMEEEYVMFTRSQGFVR